MPLCPGWLGIGAQVNALCARFPRICIDFSNNDMSCSKNEIAFENGYSLLPHCEGCPYPLSDYEQTALRTYWIMQDWPNVESMPTEVCRWVKLGLPNGQKAQSVWYETSMKMKLRRTSCVEVSQWVSSIKVLIDCGLIIDKL